MTVEDEIYLYISLKAKPLPQSEILADKLEWMGNNNLTIEQLNIMILFGYHPTILRGLLNLWRDKKIALVDVHDGQFAYAISGRVPNYPMASDWKPYPVLHWRPILIYSDDLLWRNLRSRKLTWQNVLPYDKFTRRAA